MPTSRTYDVIVLGSGFGGAFASLPLVRAGARVLMLERGEWVARGPHDWQPQGSLDLTSYCSMETPYRVASGGVAPLIGSSACVGGPSVFYGGVALRLRGSDFERRPEVSGSGSEWPFGMAELEPFYDRVEGILAVAGEAGSDPTEAPRSGPCRRPPAPLSETSRLVSEAGRRLGLRPFPLPLAINFEAGARPACQACATCDTFACAVSAKNDVATAVLPDLIRNGLELRPRVVTTGLRLRGRRVVEVECVDAAAGTRVSFRADRIVMAAGALGSPHLLRAAGLAAYNPAADVVGRYLTRHAAAIQYALFPRLPDAARPFHKQVGFHDFYHGADAAPPGQLGSIQQVQSPPAGLVQARVPVHLDGWIPRFLSHVTGLLVLAEDQPVRENGVTVDRARVDRFGLPQLVIAKRETARDEAARTALLRRARRILREAGAVAFYRHVIRTFSHAAGTVRMGTDPRTAPLDEWCRFRGVDNLWVPDASALPTAGGVNPSLTIAANALRVGERLAREGG